MRRLLTIIVLAVGGLLLMAPATYNPGVFPGRYTTGAAALASGVISATPGMLSGCEFINGNAATRYIMIFDKATVPADGTGGFTSAATTGWKIIIQCAASSFCVWGMNGPNTTAQGGSGVVFQNGISWANSSTQPTKTIGSADTTGACSYQN